MKKFIYLAILSAGLVAAPAWAAKKSEETATVQSAVAQSTDHARVKKDETAPVNINSASADELATLKGVGAKRAQAIVDYRTAHGAFKSVDDLTGVRGISAKSLARLQKDNPGRINL